MSKLNSIILKNNRISFFPIPVCRHPFTQPKGTSYAAWQKQLKKLLSACIKRRRPLNNAHMRYKTLIHKLQSDMRGKLSKQREQLITEQTTTILNQLETTDSEIKEDIKLELITMCKQFCERKGIYEQVEATIPDRR